MPDDYDLCVKYPNGYIDITLRYDYTWGLKLCNHDSGKRFATRDAAIDYLETAQVSTTFA